jgi:glycerol-3-phosphate acyltransferase PlsY
VVATHYVSLGSVVSVALLPPLAGLLFDAREPVVVAGSAVAVLVTFKHIGNLKRLAAGTESRLGRRK